MNTPNNFQANDKSTAKQNTPSAPVKTNPVNQVVEVMRKIHETFFSDGISDFNRLWQSR